MSVLSLSYRPGLCPAQACTRCSNPAPTRAAGRVRAVALAAAAVLASASQAQGTTDAADTVVVTGSARALRLLDAPFAIQAVDADALRAAGPQVNLSESLVRVPGLVVNNRNNYAQDLQLSSRGFGARAAFGVRGLRLYTDGIPATMPDGQGQVAHMDLAGAERVEVLRGPFSVLYGNSSGGVIAAFTAPVKHTQAEVALDAGSFGLQQQRVGATAVLGGGLDLRASASHMSLDGFRPHSAARRDLANLRLGWQGGRDRVVVQASFHDQVAQDPLGLTPEAFAADPRQVATVATQFDTRKSTRQSQGGVSWQHSFGEGVLRSSAVAAYLGSRAVMQFQSIAVGAQTAATASGGVVDLDRGYQGVDARLNWRFGDVDVVTGVDLEQQSDERRGYENFTGTGATQVLGVTGRPRRDETNRASTRDAYAQLLAPLGEALALTAGVRGGRVQMRTSDRYITCTGTTRVDSESACTATPANRDDSGELAFSYLNPAVGLRWTVSPGWTLHASAARGFESPTLTELAYKPAGQTEGGFNRSLSGQTSRQIELGSKWRGRGLQADLALFQADTADEIGTLTNTGGRAVFQNVGRTQRRGAELALGWRLLPSLRAAAALTWLQAEYRDGFASCTGTPCNTTTTPMVGAVAVDPGNRIAGTAARSGFAELVWAPGGRVGEFGLEWRGMARMAANDSNTTWAPGYGLAALRWHSQQPIGAHDVLDLLARVDNLLDRPYVGSVIVNDGNGRFFEPGSPRSLLLSARWQHRF